MIVYFPQTFVDLSNIEHRNVAIIVAFKPEIRKRIQLKKPYLSGHSEDLIFLCIQVTSRPLFQFLSVFFSL